MWKRDNSGGGLQFRWLLQERHAFLLKFVTLRLFFIQCSSKCRKLTVMDTRTKLSFILTFSRL